MKRFFTFLLPLTFFLALGVFVGLSSNVFALQNPPGGGGGGGGENPPGNGGVGGASYILENPLGYSTVCTLLTAVTNLVVEVAAVIAVIMIIWVGLRFVRAQGEPKALQDAKNAFLNTIIGTAILLGASVIAKIVVNTILSITKASGNSTC